jgi:hypothetical protein
MLRQRKSVVIFALLLAVLFLGAQFHFCADINPGPASSHICPVCSAAASVVVTSTPAISFARTVNRLEASAEAKSPTAVFLPSLSSRAPPAN